MKAPTHPGVERLRKTSIAELAGRIRRARAMDLAKLSDQQVRARIGPLLDGYATKLVVIRTNGVFRARVVPANVDLFSHASEVWYPPTPAVQRAGRFNRPGDVRFYSSNRTHAALSELRVKPGDRLTLVVAASKRPAVDIECAHVGLHRCLEEPEIMGIARNGLRSALPFLRDLKEMGIERKWIRIDDYLTDLAVAEPPPEKEQDLYKATNVISDTLYRIPAQRALLYPSVATDLHAFNLALSPEHADEYFFPAECWQFEIVSHHAELPGAPPSKHGYIGLKMTARSTEVTEGGEISWRSAKAEELPELQQAILRAGEIRKQRYPQSS